MKVGKSQKTQGKGEKEKRENQRTKRKKKDMEKWPKIENRNSDVMYRWLVP